MAATIRRADTGDRQALQNIWINAFGSGDESVFFDHFSGREICIVAVHDDTPAAAGYILPAGNLKCGGLSFKCAMIYSVATHPEYRNRGFGAAVVRELISAGHAADCEAVVLCPSDDGLFEYYSTHTQLRDWFYICEKKYETAPAARNCVELTAVTANEYNHLREDMLSGIPHIEFDIHALSYQSVLCSRFGGGMYRAEAPGAYACAVVERQSRDSVWVKEIMTSGIRETEVVSAIAREYPAAEYIVRRPARSPAAASGTRRFGMLAADGNAALCLDGGKNEAPYYGLAFD